MMEVRISELMEDYNDEEFTLAGSDVTAERIRRRTMRHIGAGPGRGRKLGRVLLLAATLILGLSAAAVAVYQYGMRDMVIEQVNDDVLVVSALGWRDTPEYQAFVEWNAFMEEYSAGHEIPDVKFNSGYPIEYLGVGAVTPEMMDALDGILDKYGLTLHSAASIVLPAEGSGIDPYAILTGDVGFSGGYAYDDGTMMLEFDQTLSNGETAELQLFSAVKGTFTRVSGGMDSEYEEWTYTAADGTALNLIMGERSSMIVADMDNVFVTAHTAFHNVSGHAALEELADSISWKTLNAGQGFSKEFYEIYHAERLAEAEESNLAYAAEQELKDWMLSEDIIQTHYLESRGRSAEDTEDGSAWVEWTYAEHEGDGAIRVRFERPAGDIGAAFEAMLAEYGAKDAAVVLTNVPIYIRTEKESGAEIETTYKDFTVYITNASDGGVTALWLDGAKNLIFTLTADAGELTDAAMKTEIAGLISGREPYPMTVDPAFVWGHMGRYEPEYLPEGWYLEQENVLAAAMRLDGVWSGCIMQIYATGNIGEIIWFTYETVPEGAALSSAMVEAYGSEERLREPDFSSTEITINGCPGVLCKIAGGAQVIWIDEDAGVRFRLSGDDAETVLAIAESVTLQ